MKCCGSSLKDYMPQWEILFWELIPYSLSGAQIRRGLQLFTPKYLSYYPTKPYDMGTLKNCETILLSAHNIRLEGQIRMLEHSKLLIQSSAGKWTVDVLKLLLVQLSWHWWINLNPFPHIDAFWRLCSRRLFENIVTKEKIAQN